MFNFKTSALAKEKQREICGSKKDCEKKETWERIKSRNDLTETEKELLMLLHYADCIQQTDLKSEYKKQYQSLKDKGYAHKLDDTHTFYHTEPLLREEAEKMAMEYGWKKPKNDTTRKDDFVRFLVVESQDSPFERKFDIHEIVDAKTGVHYLYVKTGDSGGVTPLLDSEGKVVVSPVNC